MKKFIRGLALLPVGVVAVALGVLLGLIGLAMLPLIAAQAKLTETAFKKHQGEEDHAAEQESTKSG